MTSELTGQKIKINNFHNNMLPHFRGNAPKGTADSAK